MKRIIFLVFTAVLICTFFCGCAINPENTVFSHEYIVSALGFDFNDGLFEVYMETVVVNSEDYNAERKTELLKGSGETLESAMNSAENTCVIPLELSHCAVAAIAKNVPAENFSEICTLLENEPQIPLGLLLVSCDFPETLLSGEVTTSVAKGYEISDMTAKRSLKNGINFKNRFYEISEKRRNPVGVFSLPYFETDGETFMMKGINVYKNDAFSMHVPENLLPFYSVASDTQSKGEFIINQNQYTVEKSYTVYDISNSPHPEIRLVCNLKINGGKESQKLFKKGIEELFLLSQKEETDIFGLGNILSRKESEYFNKIRDNYDSVYKNFELAVTVK